MSVIESFLSQLTDYNGIFISAKPNVWIIKFPKNGTDFCLEELQKFVGGHIEVVYFDDYLMIINEEGKLNQLPVNFMASTLYQSYYGETDYIVGDCLICKNALVK